MLTDVASRFVQERLANISDTVHSTPDPQEILVNISDTVHSTLDPQETLANRDTVKRTNLEATSVSIRMRCVVNCITNVR
jgi:hypothetical protein